jgi:hypothetical protein
MAPRGRSSVVMPSAMPSRRSSIATEVSVISTPPSESPV